MYRGALPCEHLAVDESLRMHVQPELRDPALVLAFKGWNDAGQAASLALDFIGQSIQSVPLADIDPEEFYDFTVERPVVSITVEDERVINWPETHFRYGPVEGDRELIIAVGVEPHLRWRRYCESVVGLALDSGVERVVLLGAYLADVVYSQPVALTGFSTDPAILPKLSVNSSRYQGPTGIVGVLADAFEQEGLSVTNLWAGLPHYIDTTPNPRGSLALVQKLSECLGFRIDESPLRQEAAEYEEKISAMVSSDNELLEYVRQLKRREFAQ